MSCVGCALLVGLARPWNEKGSWARSNSEFCDIACFFFILNRAKKVLVYSHGKIYYILRLMIKDLRTRQ
jgi:hypothetical protein